MQLQRCRTRTAVHILVGAVALLAPIRALEAADAPPPNKPNIIFILTDDKYEQPRRATQNSDEIPQNFVRIRLVKDCQLLRGIHGNKDDLTTLCYTTRLRR